MANPQGNQASEGNNQNLNKDKDKNRQPDGGKRDLENPRPQAREAGGDRQGGQMGDRQGGQMGGQGRETGGQQRTGGGQGGNVGKGGGGGNADKGGSGGNVDKDRNFGKERSNVQSGRGGTQSAQLEEEDHEEKKQ